MICYLFLEMQKWLISAWIRRKEIVNEEIAVFGFNRTTQISER